VNHSVNASIAKGGTGGGNRTNDLLIHNQYDTNPNLLKLNRFARLDIEKTGTPPEPQNHGVFRQANPSRPRFPGPRMSSRFLPH